MFVRDRNAHDRDDILVDLIEIIYRYCCGVGFLLFCHHAVLVLYLDGARSFLIGSEAVHKYLVIRWDGPVRAEVQSEKNRLDPDAVKAVSFFCHCVDLLDGSIQQSEAVLHIPDAGGILRRHIFRYCAAVEAQFYHCCIVGGRAGGHRAEQRHQQDRRGEDGRNNPANALSGPLVREQRDRRLDDCRIRQESSLPGQEHPAAVNAVPASDPRAPV